VKLSYSIKSYYNYRLEDTGRWRAKFGYPRFASNTIKDNLGNGTMTLFLQSSAGNVAELFCKIVAELRKPFGRMLGESTLKGVQKNQKSKWGYDVMNCTLAPEWQVICKTEMEKLKRNL
jgi:hypothetical protein